MQVPSRVALTNLPFHPRALWLLSTELHQRGHRRSARLLKAFNFLAFRAVLPPEAKLGGWVALGHFGLSTVIHPNVSIGGGSHIHHGVTLACEAPPGVGASISIGDNVTIGAGAIVVNHHEGCLRIGDGAVIGAGSVVTKDVDSWTIVAGNPARVIRRRSDIGRTGRY